MSDLRTLLHDTAIPSTDTSAAVADAQLAHARGALRKRSAKRVSLGSTFVAAAALTAFAMGGHAAAPASPEAHASTSAKASGVKLVSYTGAQPTGYFLDQVPAGWAIADDDLSLLTLAPVGATPEQAPPGMTSLVGKIAITTQSTGLPSGVQLDDVQVGGHPAVVAHMLGSGDTHTLFVEQPSGTYLEIQVWTGLGWSNDEIVAFADSVHINAGAQKVAG